MAKFLGAVRTKMLTKGLPAVLDDLDDDGTLHLDSTLRPKRPWQAGGTAVQHGALRSFQSVGAAVC